MNVDKVYVDWKLYEYVSFKCKCMESFNFCCQLQIYFESLFNGLCCTRGTIWKKNYMTGRKYIDITFASTMFWEVYRTSDSNSKYKMAYF